jgi:hypothetical protein
MTRFHRSVFNRRARVSARRVLQTLLRRLARIEDRVLGYCARRRTRRGPDRMLALVPSGSAARETTAPGRAVRSQRGLGLRKLSSRMLGTAIAAAILLALAGVNGVQAQESGDNDSAWNFVAAEVAALAGADPDFLKECGENPGEGPEFQAWLDCLHENEAQASLGKGLVSLPPPTPLPGGLFGNNSSVTVPPGGAATQSRSVETAPQPDLKRAGTSVSRQLACGAQLRA